MKLLKIFEQINAGNFSQMITKMYFVRLVVSKYQNITMKT